MGITVSGDGAILVRLSKLENEIEKSPKEIVKAVSEARNMIEKRTLKGKDYKGNDFEKLEDDVIFN